MAGHLFIVRGNLLEVACDAVLIPTGVGTEGNGEVLPHWKDSRLVALGGYVKPAPTERRRIVLVTPFKSLQEPAIWAGHTGAAGKNPAWFAAAAAAYVREAGISIRPGSGTSRPLDDARPLLALPLIGTGKGGMKRHKGEVVQAVVDAIDQAQRDVDADVVLVLNNAEGYAAAQKARRRIGPRVWELLSSDQQQAAGELARLARDERLVLFLGAGASIGAGLPSWGELLEQLAQAALPNSDQRESLKKLDPRDAGDVLAGRFLEQGTSLADQVCALTEAARGSLTHQLLASLPIHEAVTTNYDTLFERAWTNTGRKPRVLPRQDAQDASTWLLKLHGSVDDQRRIVLSRQDTLRLEGDGEAVSGVVQAMLLTRHMLFVGYSLSDDNFHRIVHQVRRGIGSPEQRPRGGSFGTALTPDAPGLTEELWADDITFLSTASGQDTNVRRLAVLLDFIGAEAAAPAAHMLDDTYASLLSPQELELRNRLLDVWSALENLESELPASVTTTIEQALARIGRPNVRRKTRSKHR